MPTYNDGATHTVNSASVEIIVTSATTVDVETGADVVASAVSGWDAQAIPGITASGAGTIVSVTGGTATGGGFTATSNNPRPGAGVAISGGASLTVSGGTINGGPCFQNPIPAAQGAALFAEGFATVTITGGSFSSGPFESINASGAAGSVLSITGGTFVGSTLILVSSTGTASISGGTFNGGFSSTKGYSGFGGMCPHILAAADGGAFDISGGSFGGVVKLEASSTGSIVISGGSFESIVLSLTGAGTITFHGTGLSFSGGTLTGMLSDGSPISTTLAEVVPVYSYTVTTNTSTEVVLTGN